ncbi:glyceraldehyde-3-phosphate dehydrogenase [Sphingobacterium bovistauri]|uniref:Glyceraldehyde-3-phosphate dehydrogenase n=1 Tax=Sphingobacterium bovistauri TaxID=2781959 RepID=A0ABS7Z7W2_9SPHI|nr:glyceraldehyde-3-phosphate dehydrogenase [Sphingobacterium bovistauri]MCA5006283.1 glyceraldehyde-3-phosphate dehydrogenase [Sphingobacterium bovistauri]
MLTDCLNQFEKQREECLTITLLANSLWKDRKVLCLYHGYSLVDEKVDHLLNFHRQSVAELTAYKLHSILAILKDLVCLPELPAVIDVGLLKDSFDESQSINKESLIAKLWAIHLQHSSVVKDVVLYGFGRIGRILAREFCSDPALKVQLSLRAVVTRDPVNLSTLQKRASLLAKDSIHGPFKGRIDIDEQSHSLIINGIPVRFISAQDPSEVNYPDYGIDNALLIDNTGKYRDKKSLTNHLPSGGIAKVIVTAPAKDIPNVVFGVNHTDGIKLDQQLFSTASCTTNAIAPVLQVLDKQYGIAKAHIETIHAYTNDQNLVDNMHAKARRGRAAALNMVITETGAGAAVAKIIPKLKDKITANAIRVPIANGSLAILVVELYKKTSMTAIHQLIMSFALKPAKHKQIDLSFDEDLVSSDVVGNPAAGIIDATATSLSADGHTLTLYVWYDNEYGYSMQVLGFAGYLAKDHMEVNAANEVGFEVVDLLEVYN